ncbi:MAG: dynamin family protein [Desulfobacteraceae bacterium]|nr:dynamin family protein [Desulfobacteraceae bacterium]
MYRENYINSLRLEMVEMVREYLSPVGLKYGYADVALESTIKWRPLVLVVGNYSSGKSTLINEFLGADIQAVGQAPTDDSFTILTYDEDTGEAEPVRITEERDGKFLLNDPDYPFEILKKHGHRFASHFRLKKVNSPFLRNLALIDTPGMLDSITERDRGYDYQDVIGDMAQLADLVLVFFDPHKAGTVREAHTSLRETITARTFEDRVLFVLNRIDECASLSDLLQVYGTLCWNLSQITGRKDIPPIHLTYSSRAAGDVESFQSDGFLYLLQNQRRKLKEGILDAPRRRLDNLASFIETHSERLDQLLEAIVAYRTRLRDFRIKLGLIGGLLGLVCGGAAVLAEMSVGISGGFTDPITVSGGIGALLLFLFLWNVGPMRFFVRLFHHRTLKNINRIIPLETQTHRDTWQVISPVVLRYLEKTGGRFPLRTVKNEHNRVHRIYTEGAREVRKALNELAGIKPDQSVFDGLSRPIRDEAAPPEPESENPEAADTADSPSQKQS